jgi:hypothetical protein
MSYETPRGWTSNQIINVLIFHFHLLENNKTIILNDVCKNNRGKEKTCFQEWIVITKAPDHTDTYQLHCSLYKRSFHNLRRRQRRYLRRYDNRQWRHTCAGMCATTVGIRATRNNVVPYLVAGRRPIKMKTDVVPASSCSLSVSALSDSSAVFIHCQAATSGAAAVYNNTFLRGTIHGRLNRRRGWLMKRRTLLWRRNQLLH